MREIVYSEREFEQAIFDYETMGWAVTQRQEGRAVLERGLRSDWLWHLPFFILAPIYGNIVFSGYRRFDRPEQVVIWHRQDGTQE